MRGAAGEFVCAGWDGVVGGGDGGVAAGGAGGAGEVGVGAVDAGAFGAVWGGGGVDGEVVPVVYRRIGEESWKN